MGYLGTGKGSLSSHGYRVQSVFGRKETLLWIKRINHEHAGSFKFVCQTVGIDPQGTQRRLLDRLAALGGSAAVIPLRKPKNSIARQPRSHHRGRIPRKVLVCRKLRQATAAGSSSAETGARSAEASICSVQNASAAEGITPRTVTISRSS